MPHSLTAPIFSSPKRIHLADIDGSGNTDIIYVGHDGVSPLLQPVRQFLESSRTGSRNFPPGDDLTVNRGDGPAGQRHRVPRVVIAAGG